MPGAAGFIPHPVFVGERHNRPFLRALPDAANGLASTRLQPDGSLRIPMIMTPSTGTSHETEGAWATRFRLLVSAILVLLCSSVLIHQFFGVAVAALISSGCFVLFFVVGQKMMGWRERGLLIAALALTAAAFVLHRQPAVLVETSLQRASFLAAFMILLAMLRVGALQSSAVLSLGEFLTRQPPGRRYLSIHAGSHVLGVLLNFGALSLIGPLIKRGVDATREAEPEAAAIREERQLSALIRGFSWMIAWSPTAVTQALIPVVVIGADPVTLAGMGALMVLAVLPVAWLNDRIVGGRARRRLARDGVAASAQPLKFPRGAARRFGLVCLMLVILSAVTVLSTGVVVIVALMLVAPIVTLGWLWFQSRAVHDPPLPETGFGARVRALLTISVPRSMPEALTLATGGYIGLMLAGLVDPATAARALQIDRLPVEAIYLLAAALVPLLSNLALPPILVATFFGSLLINVPGLNLDPTLLGFCFVMGWCLNLTASPFGATALVLGRATGVKGTTLSWRWNGAFSIVSYGLVAMFIFLYSA